MCFADLTEAFQVQVNDVKSLLQKRRIHQNIIKIIKELYSANYTYVQTANKLGIKIPVTTGIRQGNSIPFNIILLETINEVWRVGRDYLLGELGIDDSVIKSEDG